MTREIRVNERGIKNGHTSARPCADRVNPAAVRSTYPSRTTTEKSTLCKVADFCRKASRIKREIADNIMAISERLADKTAREGLFGEDRGKGYAGTDVDYIER